MDALRPLRPLTNFSNKSSRRAGDEDESDGFWLVMATSMVPNGQGGSEPFTLTVWWTPRTPQARKEEEEEEEHIQSPTPWRAAAHHAVQETPATLAHPGSLCHNPLNEMARAFNSDLRRQVLSVN